MKESKRSPKTSNKVTGNLLQPSGKMVDKTNTRVTKKVHVKERREKAKVRNVRGRQTSGKAMKEGPGILQNAKDEKKTYEKRLYEMKQKFHDESKKITSRFHNKKFDYECEEKQDIKTSRKASVFQNFNESLSFSGYKRTCHSKHDTTYDIPVELLYKAPCASFSDAYDGVLDERASDILDGFISDSTDFKINKYKNNYSKIKKRWDTVIGSKSKEEETKRLQDVENRNPSVTSLKSVKSLPTCSSKLISEKLSKPSTDSTNEEDLREMRKDLALKEIMTLITSFKTEKDISMSESETSEEFIKEKFLKYKPSKFFKKDVQPVSSPNLLARAKYESIRYAEQRPAFHKLSDTEKKKIVPLTPRKTAPHLIRKISETKQDKLKSRSQKNLNCSKRSRGITLIKQKVDEILMNPPYETSFPATSIVTFKSNNSIPIALEYLMQIAEAIYYNACHEAYSDSSKNCEQVAAAYKHLMTLHEPHVLISEAVNSTALITVVSKTNMHTMKLPFNLRKYLKFKLNIHVLPDVKLDRPVLIKEGMRLFSSWKNYQFPATTEKTAHFVQDKDLKLQALSKSVPNTKDLKYFVNAEIKRRPIFMPEPKFKYVRGTDDVREWMIREQRIENKNTFRKMAKLEENLANKKQEVKNVMSRLEKRKNIAENHKCGCDVFSNFVTDILWKTSRERKVVEQFMISHEFGCFIFRNVIPDFVSFVNMQLISYIKNYEDKSGTSMCVDVDQEQFILHLCGIVNNVIALAPASFLMSKAEKKRELILNIIKLLYKTSEICNTEFKRILLSVLYNLNFHQFSRDVILDSPDILKYLTDDLRQYISEDSKLLTLKLVEFLTWKIPDISTFKKFLPLLPLLKNIYRNARYSSELKFLIRHIISNFREGKKKYMLNSNESMLDNTCYISREPIIC